MKQQTIRLFALGAMSVAVSGAWAQNSRDWGPWNLRLQANVNPFTRVVSYDFVQDNDPRWRELQLQAVELANRYNSPALYQAVMDAARRALVPTTVAGSDAPYANTGDWTGYASGNGSGQGKSTSMGVSIPVSTRSTSLSLTLRPNGIATTNGSGRFGGTVDLSATINDQGFARALTYSGATNSFTTAGYSNFNVGLSSPGGGNGAVYGFVAPENGRNARTAEADYVTRSWGIGGGGPNDNNSGGFVAFNSGLTGSNGFDFVAGQTSSLLDLNSLKNRNFVGTFNGGSSMGHLVSMTVNFGPATWTGSFTNGQAQTVYNGLAGGNSFTGSGTISGVSFSGTATGNSIASGSVEGNFVGPNGQGLIGRVNLVIETTSAARTAGHPNTAVLNTVFSAINR